MNREPESASYVTVPTYAISRTRPDEILRHDISDEELDLLLNTSSGYWNEGLWAACGGAIGLLPSAVAALVDAYGARNDGTPNTPLSILDLSQIVVLAMCIAAIGILFFVTRNRTARADKLKQVIRDRAKQRVTG